jgi:L-ascorbate metabolism protein UlaG (beta-lactamase superfamily)
MRPALGFVVVATLVGLGAASGVAQDPAKFTEVKRLADGQVSLRISSLSTHRYHLQISPDLSAWSSLTTFRGATAYQFTDSAGPFLGTRYYRVQDANDPTALTGDHFATDDGDVLIHPINHASLVVAWKGKMIYVDPVGGSSPYSGLPRADLTLVTHNHPDHFETGTLNSVKQAATVIMAPAAAYSSMSAQLKALTTPLANGESADAIGVHVEAIPAYNPSGNYHLKGVGNSYVVTIGGRKLFFSGDTEDVPEMRALTEVDVAFLCMNQPFTMTVNKAASAVREFKPRIVYPYHYRNQDGSLSNLGTFRTLVGLDLGIEVRQRAWY